MAEEKIIENEVALKIKAFLTRIWKILSDTENEWKEISRDAASDKDFYINYIIPLAAIGPIASFIGFGYVGLPGFKTLPILYCFLQSSITFIFTLASVYMMAVLISSLTYVTGNYDDDGEAIKVAAYAYTPYLLASALYINPLFTPAIIILGFYGLFIAFFGLRIIMQSPPWLAGCALPILLIFAFAFGLTPYFLTRNLYQIYIGKIHFQQTEEAPVQRPRSAPVAPQNPSNVIVPSIEPHNPSDRGEPIEAPPPLKKR